MNVPILSVGAALAAELCAGAGALEVSHADDGAPYIQLPEIPGYDSVQLVRDPDDASRWMTIGDSIERGEMEVLARSVLIPT